MSDLTEYSDTMGELDARLVARLLSVDPFISGDVSVYYLAGGFWGVLIDDGEGTGDGHMVCVYGEIEEDSGHILRACDSRTCHVLVSKWSNEDGEMLGSHKEMFVGFEEVQGAVDAILMDFLVDGQHES